MDLMARTGMQRVITSLSIVGLVLAFGAQAAPPHDMPILTIHPVAEGAPHVLSLADLKAYPQRSVTGFIPDVDDQEAEWTGVSLASLLKGLGEPLPARLTASAMDSYREAIPGSDLEVYDPIIAYQRNGEYLNISQRGPLVIMYPYGEHPELLTRVFFSRTVWQLDELRLE